MKNKIFNKKNNKTGISASYKGFTLIEMILVIVILGMVAACVVPMLTSAASFQVQSAADLVAADIEFARSLSISRQEPYTVVLNTIDHSIEVKDSSGNVINHPVSGKPFRFVFTEDSRVSSVRINSANFDGYTSVTFDDLGSPYSGSNLSSPMNSGEVVLSAEGYSCKVKIEPVTGYIRIIN